MKLWATPYGHVAAVPGSESPYCGMRYSAAPSRTAAHVVVTLHGGTSATAAIASVCKHWLYLGHVSALKGDTV